MNVTYVLQEEYDTFTKKRKRKLEWRKKLINIARKTIIQSRKSNVCSSYYETKLAVHNFTIYDIKTHDAIALLILQLLLVVN
jgi:hypothetical protein